jgi:hypothetical protein
MIKSDSGNAVNVNINIVLPKSLSSTKKVTMGKIYLEDAPRDDAPAKTVNPMRVDDVIEISPKARKLAGLE